MIIVVLATKKKKSANIVKWKKSSNSFCVLWGKVASAVLACTVRYLSCEE